MVLWHKIEKGDMPPPPLEKDFAFYYTLPLCHVFGSNSEPLLGQAKA